MWHDRGAHYRYNDNYITSRYQINVRCYIYTMLYVKYISIFFQRSIVFWVLRVPIFLRMCLWGHLRGNQWEMDRQGSELSTKKKKKMFEYHCTEQSPRSFPALIVWPHGPHLLREKETIPCGQNTGEQAPREHRLYMSVPRGLSWPTATCVSS